MKLDKDSLLTIRAFAIWGGVTFGLLAILALAGAGAEIAYRRLYVDRVFPGVHLLGVRLDGLTRTEARTAVQKAVDTSLNAEPRFRFRERDVQIDATVVASEPDASRDLIRYDIDQAIDRAYGLGRGDGWWKDVVEQIGARVRPTNVPADVTIDRQGIERALRVALKDQISDAKDASFTIVLATGTEPLVHIEHEQSGLTFDAAHAMGVLAQQASRLNFVPIPLQEKVDEPTVHRQDLEPLMGDVVAVLKRPPITFAYENESYRIPMGMLAGWITVRTDDGKSQVAFDGPRVLASLRALAPTMESEAKNGSLSIKDGNIASFVPGTQGISIDIEKTIAPLSTDWSGQTVFPIVVNITSGSLLGEDPERLGIKEIIGIGKSNFSGSPSNRRKNIALGAQKVNGTIIPPGGEFSLLKTLGEIDGVHGWLPELVIKGDKTTPEFGGGLCQIGTTTFRGALDSGLKILERRNHSYRVRYYEPAGTDATIYDPSPDFRFQNDTAHSILINAYIKGDNVFFEFWGTKDGRNIDPIKSRVYNITVPPPMKLVETLDLPPGQKKCTESAHNGADADFTYHITYADGSVYEEVFKSHYRPWQAVCLVGVTELSTPPDASAQPLTP